MKLDEKCPVCYVNEPVKTPEPKYDLPDMSFDYEINKQNTEES
jgi:hypothetical protein